MPGQNASAVALEDRYRLEDGRVYLTGVQALARVALDQNRRDRAAGLRIGTFICGYPGSPLGTYDLTVQRLGAMLEQHDIVAVPGANEELAATAIMGTQMLDQFPHSRWDGVTAFWYGKGPGVDRSGDALKHGNFAGTSKHGAVVVLAGEDHEGKSSTMPFQDDYALMAAGIPILYPSSVSEFLSFGLHAVAMSRYSGCWVALKLVGPLCDGGETVTVQPELPEIVVPGLEIDGQPFAKRTDFTFFPGRNIEQERHLYQERHLAVLAYARANALDRAEVHRPGDRLGIITAGKTAADTRQALLDLGVDDGALRRAGVRMLRVGLSYPVDAALVREFASGLEEIIVIEEKRGFLESQVKEALCGPNAPRRVIGKYDENSRPLFPLHGGMDSDTIAQRLGPRLLPYLDETGTALTRLDQLASVQRRVYATHPRRTPNYCSGCPHNTSTVLLDGQLAWGSPGCHSFATLMEPKRHIEAMTQYGGEGLPWVGLSRFTDRAHMLQNVGDGSLFHSSYLNIRFCAAVGANITFKVLYNGAIANTGAQEVVGARSVPALTRLLAEEGVARTAVISKQPSRYTKERLGKNTTVHDVAQYATVMRELEKTPGVTVMIYDESCANERRRRQKRGLIAAPERFVVINEEVCENCGHCGELTNCMSLQKVETEFGPKTRIHASTCNLDYSCLGGDCPSFLTVDARAGRVRYARPTPPDIGERVLAQPEVPVELNAPYRIYIPGVGGTGVITLNALLCWAALLDRKHVLSYDQTGAAQKWGPVLSSIVLAPREEDVAANKVGLAQADLYLALDPLAAASAVNLDRCDPARTALLLVSSALPSGEMIRNVDFQYSADSVLETIREQCDVRRTVTIDARRIAEELFGDHMMTNIIALGAAYQAGILPISAASIESAVRLNGVQVDANIQAFRYGRLAVQDPARVDSLLPPERPSFEQSRDRALAPLRSHERRAYDALLARCSGFDEEARKLAAVRIAELIDYQNARYASRYLDLVLRVADRESAVLGRAGAITRATARSYFKLLAYKDEYEVARLHLKPYLREKTRLLFAGDARVSYHLHPPVLRALGLRRKIAVGPWFDPFLRLLRHGKRLRGTPFDLFGYAQLRREERRLPPWYEGVMDQALSQLTPATRVLVADLARLPESIRGYEEIKLRNIAAARERAGTLLTRLQNPDRQAEPSLA